MPNIAQKGTFVVTTLALTAGLCATTVSSATAAGYFPLDGELCTARENIYIESSNFYEGRYTVRAGDYIRIVQGARAGAGDFYAFGHGSARGDGFFTWKHSNGVSRVRDCH